MSIISLYLLFSMAVVVWFDATRYIIPNWLVGSLLLLYPVAVYMAPAAVDWQMALVGMLIVFAIGYGVFAMNWMGGGDIKLLTACALWVGWQGLPEFIMVVTLLGGALSVFLLFVRKWWAVMPVLKKLSPLPKMLQDKAPVPYGLAIAAAFVIFMVQGKIALVAF